MWWIAITIVLTIVISMVIIGNRVSQADWGGYSVNWIDGLVRLLCRQVHHLAETEIPLPESGSAIVVANHVSGLDPLLLVAASRRPLRFLIAREEYERPIIHWLFKAAGCIPVDRTGKPEQALRQALRALQAGEVLALFPHGKIHLDSDPPRRIKGGVVRLSIWAQTLIFPVRIDGVAGEGNVGLAPFIPSHVKLTIGEAIQCDSEYLSEGLEAITIVIETPGS